MGYLKATYNVTSTTTPTKLANFASGYTDVLINGFSQGRIKEYTFSTTGTHTVRFKYEIDKISDNTFINCPELEVIDIPDNIITIGYGAFQGCSNLITVLHNNSIAIISPYAFAGCHLGNGFQLWVGNQSVLDRFPNKVTFIENNVFEGCYFTDFALPDTVESIHSYAFANCPNLHTIYIGSGVTSIEANAFSSCSKLATVVCYSPTAPELDEHTFLDLYNYDGTLYYPVGSDYSSWMSANEYYLGYWDWNSVATNNIPNPDTGGGNTEPDEPTEPDNPDTGTTTSNNLICTYNVTSVTTPTKLRYPALGFTDILLDGTSIGLATGYTFPSLGEYTLEFVLEDKTSIGDNAFSGCTNLTSVVIPDSVTTIGGFAFCECSGLTSVVIGSGVTTIGNDAFVSCKGLTGELVIPDSVTSIGREAFTYCSGLTSVVIGSGVTTIGGRAFEWCKGLTGELVIPDSVTTINQDAFFGCTGLTSVTIGSGVTTIGSWAFENCYSLTGELVIPDSVITIGSSAFTDCSGLTSVVIGSGDIGISAFKNCKFLRSVVIGSGVTTINKEAFYDCIYLKTITSYSPTAPTVEDYTFFKVPYSGTLYYPKGADYSSWLSTDKYYLGCYNWNGVEIDVPDEPDNPDTGTTEVVGNISPFTTSLTVEYNVGSSSVRVGYKNIMNIHTPTSNVDWITVGTPTKLSGTFVGYDAVYQYPITISNNSGTYNRNGVITFTGYDTNGNLISSVTNVLQNAYVKPDEPDEPTEPDIPSQSGETYSPLWKDVFYTFTSDVNDYEIYKGNTLIFKGRAYLPPNASSLKLMVNKICQNYFADNCLDFDADTISSSYNTFYLKNGNGVTLHTYHFINDWSYKELKLGVKTNPIIPVVVDGQKLFFSALAVNSTYFPYSVRYDGTSYSNNEYIQNDFKTVIMPERTHKNIQSFTVSGTTYNTIPKCRCQYVLYYSNPYGGFDWFPVLGKVSKTDSVVQYTYTNNYDNTTIEFGKYRYLSEISTKYQLNTGFLTEQQSSRMWELMESNCVYLHNLVEDKIYPVLITDTEIEHKKKERGRKMLSYTINVETSQTRERL